MLSVPSRPTADDSAINVALQAPRRSPTPPPPPLRACSSLSVASSADGAGDRPPPAGCGTLSLPWTLARAFPDPSCDYWWEKVHIPPARNCTLRDTFQRSAVTRYDCPHAIHVMEETRGERYIRHC